MNLEYIGRKISSNWKELPGGLPFNSYKNEVLYFPYLSAEDIIELHKYAKKRGKRIEVYPSLNSTENLLKVLFKNVK